MSSNDKMPKSPSAYEKFICENVLKNSQKFQDQQQQLQQQHEIMSENLICESLKRIKSGGKEMQESDESESEIDLTTTSPQNSFVLDFSNNNNNNNNNSSRSNANGDK